MNKYQKKSYTIVTACFLIQAVGVGTLVSYGVFFTSLITEFNWSTGAISGAGQYTIPLVASLLIAAFGWRVTNIIMGASAIVIVFLLALLLERDPSDLDETEAS